MEILKLVQRNEAVAKKMKELGQFKPKKDKYSVCTFKLVKRPLKKIENGSFYLGEWKMGKNIRHGFGTLYRPDGSIYQGQISDNKLSGQGRFIDAGGNTYEGQFLNN